MKCKRYQGILSASAMVATTLGLCLSLPVGVSLAEESKVESPANTQVASQPQLVAQDAKTDGELPPGEALGEANVAEPDSQADEAHSHDEVEFTKWESANSLPTTAGSYYLTSDVTLESTWATPEGTTNICLNGHAIVAGFNGTDGGSLISVTEGTTLDLYDEGGQGSLRVADGVEVSAGVDVQGGGTLNLYDGTITGFSQGVFTNLQVKDDDHPAALFGTFNMFGGSVSGNSGTGVYVFSGTFNMSGGVISGNGAKGTNGAGVYVSYSGFHMSGGEITGNTAQENGGGVYVFSSTDLTMTGGSIAGNAAGICGGGVYVDGSTFAVSGGSIANNGAATGGGVYVASRTDVPLTGKLDLAGGSITGNTAAELGGGVYVTKESVLSVAGSAKVVENKAKDAASNVHLMPATLVVGGKLAEGAFFGVTIDDGAAKDSKTEGSDEKALQAASDSSAFTEGYKQAGNTADPSTYFESDDATHTVGWTEDGNEARMVNAYTVTIIDASNGKVVASATKARVGEKVTLTITPNSGFKLQALSVVDADKESVTVDDESFVMPESNVTVTATFVSASSSPSAPAAPALSRTTTASTSSSNRLARTSDASALLPAAGAFFAGAGATLAGLRRRNRR
jgi:hypothetical protein